MTPAELHLRGLNIFGSISLKELPQDVLDFFNAHGICHDVNQHTLCLVGSGGKSLWSLLAQPLISDEHPVDNFSRDAILSFDPHAIILYPHLKWNFPLQRLGQLLNLSRPSILGIDINEKFGLWFAYRGAFLTKKLQEKVLGNDFISPCQDCSDQKCLSNCPGEAIKLSGIELKKCLDYRIQDSSKCQDNCGARRACSYKPEHAYTTDQLQYHMLNSHRWLKKFVQINSKDPKNLRNG